MKRSPSDRSDRLPVRRALFGLLLGAGLLAGGEMVCRRFNKSWDQLAPNDPYWVSFFGDKRAFARLPKPTNSDSLRIFCVGGSVTAGFPFPHAGYPEWMQEELRACGLSGEIQIVNRGMGSWGSLREEFLVRQSLEETPWAVI